MSKFYPSHYMDQLSIDCVVFGYSQKELKVLINHLLITPQLGALPGGFIKHNEGIDTAAKRILQERTGLEHVYLEQFRVFGHAERKNHEIYNMLLQMEEAERQGVPFGSAIDWFSRRFVSIGYYALVDMNKVHPQKGEFDDSVGWYSIAEIPALIMDHKEIMEEGLKALQEHLDKKLIAFNLLPETFTMRELQELYEAVYEKPFPRNNFQKKILDLNVLERLEKKFTGAANKAPYLYKFKSLK